VKKSFALIVSGVFHPLLIPTLIFSVLVFYFPQFLQVNGSNSIILIALIFIFTFLFPLAALGIMRITKVISSMEIPERRERMLPFSVVCFLYMLTTYYFQTYLKAAPFLIISLAVITFILVLITAISFFWKISAHMAAISGILGTLAFFCLRFPVNELLHPLMAVILISGLVASSRLYLNAHTPAQVAGGFALGFSVAFFCFRFFM